MTRKHRLAALLLVFLSVPALAGPIDDIRVYESPDAILTEATKIANSVLSTLSKYHVRPSASTKELTYNPEATEVLAYSVRRQPDNYQHSLYVIPGYPAVFFHSEKYTKRLQQLTTVPHDFLDALSIATHLSEEIPSGMLSPGGLPGKEFVQYGIEIMRGTELRNDVLLAALLLHEIGHLANQHGIHVKEGNASSLRREHERQADQFAADLIARALVDDDISQEAKSSAYLLFHHLGIVGFQYAGTRMSEGGDAIRDTDTNYENWELRIFRMLQLVAANAVPNSKFAAHVASQLDELLLQRNEISHGELFANEFLRRLNELSEREKQAEELEQRLMDPVLLPLDPERIVLLIEHAQLLYSAGDYRTARNRLEYALKIATKLKQRANVRGIQILGPLAVIENLLGNENVARTYCSEVEPLLSATKQAPMDFVTHVTIVCDGLAAK